MSHFLFHKIVDLSTWLFHNNTLTVSYSLGIGIHIDKQLLFVSDADGYVWRFPVEQETKNRTVILSPSQLDVLPLDISVDWISDLLYIVGEMKSVKPNGKKMFLIQRYSLELIFLVGLSILPS